MDKDSAREKVSEYVNLCSDASTESNEKCEAMGLINQVLLGSNKELLPEFVDLVLPLAQDGSLDVRRSVVTFIKELSEHHTEFVPNIINLLSSLLLDTAPQILVEEKLPVKATTIYLNTEEYVPPPPPVVRTKKKKDATTIGEHSSNVLNRQGVIPTQEIVEVVDMQNLEEHRLPNQRIN